MRGTVLTGKLDTLEGNKEWSRLCEFVRELKNKGIVPEIVLLAMLTVGLGKATHELGSPFDVSQFDGYSVDGLMALLGSLVESFLDACSILSCGKRRSCTQKICLSMNSSAFDDDAVSWITTRRALECLLAALLQQVNVGPVRFRSVQWCTCSGLEKTLKCSCQQNSEVAYIDQPCRQEENGQENHL